MRVFVTGATEALGAHLVPGQVAAGHEITVTTWTRGNVALLREAGAEHVLLDGLDRAAVSARADLRSLRKVNLSWPTRTNSGPRAPAIWPVARAGTRQVIAQGHITVYESPGGPVKTDQDPLDSRLIPSAARMVADHIWRYANGQEGFRAWVSG